MADGATTVYLADANVLLNLMQVGRLEILRLASEALHWQIEVPQVIADEVVRDLSVAELLSYGVSVVRSDSSVAREVVGLRSRGEVPNRLSEADVELYVRATRESANVWTDDRPLFAFLQKRGVKVVHTFSPFVALVQQGIMAPTDVLATARVLMSVNPRFTNDNYQQLSQLLRRS